MEKRKKIASPAESGAKEGKKGYVASRKLIASIGQSNIANNGIS